MNTIQRVSSTDIQHSEKLHDQAMDTAEQASIAKLHGDTRWPELFRQAFAFEREAALTLANDYDFEPSRSVLYRSAAALALECGEWRAAEQLIGELWPEIHRQISLRNCVNCFNRLTRRVQRSALLNTTCCHFATPDTLPTLPIP